MPTVPFLGSYGDISGSGLMFRNKLINGDMYIWQRGVSFTPTTLATIYTADRWACFRAAFATGLLASRQTASGLANLPYALRVERVSGNASTAYLSANQMIESLTCYGLQGKTVTLSFHARVGSGFSAASSVLSSSIITGTGIDENVASGYANEATQAKTHTVSTSWARFTQTVNIASNVNEISVRLSYIPTGTSSGSDWFEITGVQFETGQEATPFEQRPIGTEFALCQRYCHVMGYDSSQNSTNVFGSGSIDSATVGTVYLGQFPVRMRIAPTATIVGPLKVFGANGANSAADLSANTSIQQNRTSPTQASLYISFSGGYVGGGMVLYSNTANTGIIFSAEL